MPTLPIKNQGIQKNERLDKFFFSESHLTIAPRLAIPGMALSEKKASRKFLYIMYIGQAEFIYIPG